VATRSRLQIAPELSLPLEWLTLSSVVYGARGSGKTTLGSVIGEEAYKAGQRFCAIDVKGDWWGLKATADGKGAGIPVVIFGGDHQDVPLEAVAFRHPAPARTAELSRFSGFSGKSSTFKLYLRNVRRYGLIAEQDGGWVLTEQGIEISGADTSAPATPDDLRAAWRECLVGGERAMFDFLVYNYPDAFTLEQLGEQTGYSPTSSTFKLYVRTLKRLGLVKFDGDLIRASGDLF